MGRNLKLLTGLTAFFLLLASFCAAQSLEQYNIDFHIARLAYTRAVVEQELVFRTPTSGNMLLSLPKDASGLSLSIDRKPSDEDFENGQLNIFLESAKELKLSYTTKELIDRSEFIASLKIPYDAEKARITLTLPEDVVLDRPLPDSDIGSSPAYPLPAAVTTDGMQIKLVWEYSGLSKNDEKSFFVRYKQKQSYIWVAILLVFVIAGLVAFILLRKPKIEKVVEKVVEKEDMLEKHLKEDEEQVVNILKQREGQCEQGTLRVITDFSKAKLSGLLKELEERNVIHKEKRGKKNLVFLRKL